LRQTVLVWFSLHDVTDENGRPISFIMTAGEIGDYIGAAALLGPATNSGYDADWF
jgi:transposase